MFSILDGNEIFSLLKTFNETYSYVAFITVDFILPCYGHIDDYVA